MTTRTQLFAQLLNPTGELSQAFPAGSNAAPSIFTTGDTNTGIFFPAADSVALATNGTAAVTVDAGQRTKFPTTIGVGGATPSTSGSGISFPATQSASTNANTLDDYEEGTWTPRCGDGTTPITSVSKAVYTKIGKLVTIELDCTSNSPYPGDAFLITGLPFPGGASSAGNGGNGVGFTNGLAAVGVHITGGTTNLYFQNLVTGENFSVGGVRLIFSTSYTTSN